MPSGVVSLGRKVRPLDSWILYNDKLVDGISPTSNPIRIADFFFLFTFYFLSTLRGKNAINNPLSLAQKWSTVGRLT